MAMAKGYFITIEGIEGAGKSTAMTYLQDFLKQQSCEAVLTREPGGTPFAEKIRTLLLHTEQDEPIFPLTELLLMFAARAQHIEHCIKPALHAGKWVVSDRYIDASYAYQGGGRKMSDNWLHTLDELVAADIYPDLTLLLDLPVAVGLGRTKLRGQAKDRIEQEAASFFERVRDGYLNRAHEAPDRIKIIDASGSIESVTYQIETVLRDFIKKVKK